MGYLNKSDGEKEIDEDGMSRMGLKMVQIDANIVQENVWDVMVRNDRPAVCPGSVVVCLV